MNAYPWIKALHVTAAMISGTLFLVRGLCIQLGIGLCAQARVYPEQKADLLLVGASDLFRHRGGSPRTPSPGALSAPGPARFPFRYWPYYRSNMNTRTAI